MSDQTFKPSQDYQNTVKVVNDIFSFWNVKYFDSKLEAPVVGYKSLREYRKDCFYRKRDGILRTNKKKINKRPKCWRGGEKIVWIIM